MEKEFELREKRLEEERKKRLAAIEAREKRNAAAASRANDAPSAPSASRVGATPLSFARSTSQNSSRDFGRGGDSIWEENAMNSGVGSISIGSFANASGPGGIAIGFGARSVGNGIAIGTRSFAGPGDVSIGSGSGARFPGHGQRLDSSGWGGIAIGNNVRVEGNGIAIGNNLHARPGEVKIGQTATTQPTSPASSNTSATRPTDAIGYYPGIGLQGNLIGKKVIIRCGFNETVLSINNSTNEIELISKEAELAFGNLFLTASECIFTVMDGGNMQIAFCHDKTGKYLQMNLQGTVNGHPSLTDLSKFYVVHCEEGRFAFYNKLFQRYLCLSEDEESIIASPMKHNIDEFPSTEFRWREQFTLIWALEESPSFLISSTFMDPSGASGYGEKLKLSTLRKLVSTIPNRQTKHEFVCILFDLMLNYSFNHLASLQLQVFPHLSRYTKRRISAYFQLVMIDFMLFTQKQRFSLDDIVTALLLKDADTSPMANPKLPFISLDDCKAMIWSPLFPLPKQYKPSLQVAFLFRDYQHALMNFIPLIIQRVNEAVWVSCCLIECLYLI